MLDVNAYIPNTPHIYTGCSRQHVNILCPQPKITAQTQSDYQNIKLDINVLMYASRVTKNSIGCK